MLKTAASALDVITDTISQHMCPIMSTSSGPPCTLAVQGSLAGIPSLSKSVVVVDLPVLLARKLSMSVPPCVLLFLSYAYGPSQESVLAPGTDDCDKGATLDCLRALYNFNYDIVSADKEAIGVCECH